MDEEKLFNCPEGLIGKVVEVKKDNDVGIGCSGEKSQNDEGVKYNCINCYYYQENVRGEL